MHHVALQERLADAWEDLLDGDPAATFFQTPTWCRTWYRAYRDRYEPLVLTAWREERLVALAPLAVERRTRRLVFAGDSMTDRRDVVAASVADRAAIVAEVLRWHAANRVRDPLRFGPVPTTSDTARLVRALGRRVVPRADISPCVTLDDANVDRVLGKASVRRRLRHYERQGPVRLERITTSEQWHAVRETFFAHHSARQRETGRPEVFADPRRRAFQDELLAADPSRAHVTVLRVGDRVVAEHYGYTYNGVLWWGVPAHDVAEHKHSPGQVMLARLIASSAHEEETVLDFTPGDEAFKHRFATGTIAVETLDVYHGIAPYLVRRARDTTARAVKRLRRYAAIKS
jgi:CelD/BcsL family acetyltransferase involved in cellulose biosynthesis